MNNSGLTLDKLNKLLDLKAEKITMDEFNKFKETSYSLNSDINMLLKGYGSGMTIDQINLSISSELNKEHKAYIDQVMKENLNSIKHLSSDIEELKLNFTEDGVQMGGSKFFESWLDYIELALDVLGFIPAIGLVSDIISTLLSLVRGNYLNAFFSAINIIPIIGSFVGTPGKYIMKFYKFKKLAKLMKTGKKMGKMKKLGKMKKMGKNNSAMKKIKKYGSEYDYESLAMEYYDDSGSDDGGDYDDGGEYYD